MTIEQRRNYDKLTKKQKKDFAYLEREHPNWCFDQVIAKLEFDKMVVITINNIGDVDPQNPEIWLTILGGVKVALSKIKGISDSITNAINGAISSLKQMISRGIRKVENAIKKILDSIF